MTKLVVDNKEIEAQGGTALLQACLENGIYIPNLCYLEWLDNAPASCRMCFVEIEGKDKPVASCTIKVKDGMVVKTDTPTVRRLQRRAFQLLLSVHKVDCGRCPANKKCELQRIAKLLKMGLKSKQLESLLKDTEITRDHPFLNYYPNRCILCGRCVNVCHREHGQPALTFAKRGFHTVISFYGENNPLRLSCKECIACTEICPVSALTLKNSSNRNGLHTKDL